MTGLPGTRHVLPEGATCDQHPDRPAVANVQGETDSFGFETILMCEECVAQDRAESLLSNPGRCDWCKTEAPNLVWARSYDEGLHGPTYQVCEPCKRRQTDRLQREMDEYDLDYPEDDYDPADDCGGYINGRFSWASCTLAGTEFCDFECPNAHAARRPAPGRRL